MADGPTMLEFMNISKSYRRGIPAVDDLSFTLRMGECVALLGTNGAGKTTTFRLLMGLLEPDRGTVLLDGLDVAKHPTSAHRLLGFLPEDAPLYPEMTPYEILWDLARLRRVQNPADEIERLKMECGLAEVWHRPAGKLSKGYRQRTALACALVHRPKVLVLDEPTAGLDPHQVGAFRALVARVSAGCALLISTHMLSEAESLCTRCLILNQGRLVNQTTLPVPADDWLIQWRGGEWPSSWKRGEERQLPDAWRETKVTAVGGKIEDLVQLLVRNGTEVRRVEAGRSLEQLFLTATS